MLYIFRPIFFLGAFIIVEWHMKVENAGLEMGPLLNKQDACAAKMKRRYRDAFIIYRPAASPSGLLRMKTSLPSLDSCLSAPVGSPLFTKTCVKGLIEKEDR